QYQDDEDGRAHFKLGKRSSPRTAGKGQTEERAVAEVRLDETHCSYGEDRTQNDERQISSGFKSVPHEGKGASPEAAEGPGDPDVVSTSPREASRHHSVDDDLRDGDHESKDASVSEIQPNDTRNE